MTLEEPKKELKKNTRPDALEGMTRFGIDISKAYGVPIPVQRKLAKQIGKDHKFARVLWDAGIHETRIIASMIDEPDKVTKKQMDEWVNDFNSWDLCDQCCNNLFVYTPFAHEKAIEWSGNKKEFIKRAGFTMMAVIAVHDKEAADKDFDKFFRKIKEGAVDERNFVKKAVNWALRQIGKRNKTLHKKALTCAKEIEKIDSKSAMWIAKDAVRELTDQKIIARIKKRTFSLCAL